MNNKTMDLSKKADKTQKIKDKIKLLMPSEAAKLNNYINKISSKKK